jgi:hypothetical protein
MASSIVSNIASTVEMPVCQSAGTGWSLSVNRRETATPSMTVTAISLAMQKQSGCTVNE